MKYFGRKFFSSAPKKQDCPDCNRTVKLTHRTEQLAIYKCKGCKLINRVPLVKGA